jgi:hypothetical protein
MDHGAERTIQTGGPLTNHVAVVYAGPHQKADPVIVDLARSALATSTRINNKCRSRSYWYYISCTRF